jgi:Fe-S-cluster-containing dehydrogenase component/CRP-like cAMP-binding protein
MASTAVTMERPQRWDSPFDREMSDADVAMLLKRPEFAAINARRFPPSIPLEGVLRNDCRLVKLAPGDIVIRDGDYGSSAFLVAKGQLRVVIKPGLPSEVLGRAATKRRSLFASLSQLWRNPRLPEVRDTTSYQRQDASTPKLVHDSLLATEAGRELFAAPVLEHADSIPALRAEYQTVPLSEGAIFGEIAALGRVPRTATVYAHSHATLLEIRWQGLNVLRKYDEGWRRIIDEGYRRNQLKVQIRETPILSHLSDEVVQKLADRTLFESYGTFEWNVAYKRQAGRNEASLEPVIAREGDYSDSLLILSGGFARVSKKVGNGQRTLTYLRDGDHFGLDELISAWKSRGKAPLETSLTALGYVNLLRIPANALEELVLPTLDKRSQRLADAVKRPLSGDSLLEWAVDKRYINGTQAMLIDLDRCVRCDDCVRACASTHGGNPRFIRHGESQGKAMIAHACMHCVDPVCMIGCPTGAIHRSTEGGAVVINDQACIGCGTCANSCPYDNIQLVEIRNSEGHMVLDPKTQTPILKATKCDLCFDQQGGPACVRACPHDALRRVDFQHSDLIAVE